MTMGSDNVVASTSSSMNYNIVPERTPTSSLFNPTTNQTICAQRTIERPGSRMEGKDRGGGKQQGYGDLAPNSGRRE